MKKIPSLILKWFISILLFIIILYVLNNISSSIPFYFEIVNFIRTNAVFLVLMSIVMLISDMFYALPYPHKIPAPIFSAVFSVMMTMFVIKILLFMENLLKIKAVSPLAFMFNIIYIIVAIVVLMSGYYGIISAENKQQEKKAKTKT